MFHLAFLDQYQIHSAIFQLPKSPLVGAHSLYWEHWQCPCVVLQNPLCLQTMVPPVSLLWLIWISPKTLIKILIRIMKKSCPSSSILSSVLWKVFSLGRDKRECDIPMWNHRVFADVSEKNDFNFSNIKTYFTSSPRILAAFWHIYRYLQNCAMWILQEHTLNRELVDSRIAHSR